MSHNYKGRQNRRKFLKNFAAASLFGSGASAMNGKLSLIGSALAQSSEYQSINDYKALVCVFLYGGADSFNMFIPATQDAYDRYATSRGGLAIPQESLKLDASGEFGFNPLLGDLYDMYNSGKLAVIGNAGNLIAPVNRALFEADSTLIPNNLFAHNHQQEQWLKGLSSLPTSLVGTGWGGRMADLLQDANSGASLPPGFSMNGTNYWLPGQTIQPISLHPTSGLSLLNYLDEASGRSGNAGREAALNQILNLSSNHPMKQQVASSIDLAKSASGQIVNALELNTDTGFETEYDPDSRLAPQLRMVARMIKSNQLLGMKRQIFFVGGGGWDTHDNQSPRLEALLTDLNRSMTDFQSTMEEMGLGDSVTTFTASDFGRTLTTNGDGSDHGWGGNYMVMGGAVNGGQMFGSLPSYELGSEDDSSDKGRVIPSLSINQYGAALAEWMGVSSNDLSEVFPDLSNFDSDWRDNLPLFSPV